MIFNVLTINERIKSEIIQDRETLNSLTKELKYLKWISENSLIESDRYKSKKKLIDLRQSIKEKELNAKYIFYIWKTEELVQTIKEFLNKCNKQFFLSIDSQDIFNKKKELYNSFFHIAKEFTQLEDFSGSVGKIKCNCGSLDLYIEEDSIYICKECSLIIETLDEIPTFKDTDRVNMSTKYRYTKKGHFIDAMKQFQGKQNIVIPNNVIKKIELDIIQHNLTNNCVSKERIYEFLSSNSMTKFYEDLNLIYHIITKFPLPDISIYEKQLLDMFDYQEKIYEEIKDPSRINSLNVNYKLFKLLQLLDYPCTKSDFFILKTQSKLNEHDQKWSEIIDTIRKRKDSDKNLWRFIPTV
jgi:Poxvirus Late Transcription Factor VLTF3 like